MNNVLREPYMPSYQHIPGCAGEVGGTGLYINTEGKMISKWSNFPPTPYEVSSFSWRKELNS